MAEGFEYYREHDPKGARGASKKEQQAYAIAKSKEERARKAGANAEAAKDAAENGMYDQMMAERAEKEAPWNQPGYDAGMEEN